MVRQGLSRLLLLGLLACVSTACAASTFDGHVYQNGPLRFRVGQIPSAWRAIDVEDALLAFRDDPMNATVAVNGRCGVDGDDVPLASLTQHLFLQFTDRQIVELAEYYSSRKPSLSEPNRPYTSLGIKGR